MDRNVADVIEIKTISQNDLLRFCSRVVIVPNGCWEWLGQTVNGYSRIYYQGRYVRAARFSYAIFNGPIPAGLTMDHLCRNVGCVNPEHLEAVTQYVNNHRAAAWLPRASRTHCGHGHEFSVENTYLASRIGRIGTVRTCRQCKIESRNKKRAEKLDEYACRTTK